MLAPPLFRRRLAARILLLAGAAQLGCRGGAPVAAGASVTNGASSASSTSGSGGHATSGATGAGGMCDAGGGGGAGGAGGSGGSPGLGGAGGAALIEQACFGWPDDAGPADAGDCPTNEIDALVEFLRAGCPTGFTPHRILSPPTMGADECCYTVELGICPCGGRPYLADGVARVSEPENGGSRGWTQGDAPALGDLTPGDRAALAEAWTAEALFEHASVASFARFALALLAAGAPADLVALAHEAALDEVRHAALCFALASTYAGERVAPGPFPLGGVVSVETSLAALATSTVHEGCVGETVAAVLAAEQLARATDPAVRAALERIAEDESRHAELAWRTVAWAVRVGGREVEAAAAGAFADALANGAGGAERAGETRGVAAREAHGQVAAGVSARAAMRALVEVVGPGARALFERAPGGAD